MYLSELNKHISNESKVVHHALIILLPQMPIFKPSPPQLMRTVGRISQFLNKIEYCKLQIGVYFTKSLLISSIVLEICSLA